VAIKTFDSKDQVPDAQRDAAIEIGGKWIVEEIDPKAISPAAQTALTKIREEKEESEKKRQAAEVELAQLKAEREARQRGATEEEINKRRAEIDAALKPLQEQIVEKDRKLRQVLHIDRVRSLALAAGIMPDRINKAMKELKDRTDLTEDGKGLVVKDEDGNVLATRIEDFLARDFKAEAPYYYIGSNTSGSGSRPNSGTAPTGADRDTKNQDTLNAEKRAIVSSAF
jgi:hypothetical protein